MIPLIDFADVQSAKQCGQVRDALLSVGFFRLRVTTVDPADVLEAARRFFVSSSEEEKRRLMLDGNFRGYSSLGNEFTDR